MKFKTRERLVFTGMYFGMLAFLLLIAFLRVYLGGEQGCATH